MFVSSSLFLMFFSCTQMEDPGAPFAAVEMDTQKNYTPSQASQESDSKEESSPKETESASEKEENPDSETHEDFVKKEEIIVSSSVDAEEKKTEEPQANVEDVVSVVAPPKTETDTIEQPNSQPEKIETASSQNEWPMRLVKTEMQLNPPRAILGLPNGEEIVIRSGTFIDDYKLVVMGIGTRSVSLAKVLPQGDHASIETIQLFSLND